MPVYTYRCENCGVQFERQQSFTDSPLKTCPECRRKALKKVITPRIPATPEASSVSKIF